MLLMSHIMEAGNGNLAFWFSIMDPILAAQDPTTCRVGNQD